MVATLNYDAKYAMRTLYAADRWGVLSVLILHSNGQAHAWPRTARICESLDRCIQQVIDARNWLIEHKAIELVPFDKRTGDEVKLPKRQFVYHLTGKVEIDGKTIPYLYTQDPPVETSEAPEDLEDHEVLYSRTSTVQNLTVSNTEDSSISSSSEDLLTNVQRSSGNIGEVNHKTSPETETKTISSGPGLSQDQKNLAPSPQKGEDDKWDKSFAASRDVLNRLSEQARADYHAGRTTPMGDLIDEKVTPPKPTIEPPAGFKLVTGTASTDLVHLRREDQTLKCQPLCKTKVTNRLNPFPEMLRTRTRCEDCWKIATAPKPEKKPRERKPQPWDDLANEIGRVFFGAKDPAGVSAVYGRIAPILHGSAKTECIGILQYECERQHKLRDELDFAELKTFVVKVWAFYQSKNPGMQLKGCDKVLDNWQACRGLQVPPPPTKPKPVAHIKYIVDPVTGKDVGSEFCDCERGENHE